MDQPKERLPNETDDQYDIRINKDMAAFGYVWVMSIIVFAMRGNKSKFVRYHSKQGMILFFASIVAALLPIIGNPINFVLIAGMILGFINANQGKYADVPLVGQLSRGEMTLADAWKEIVRVAKDIAEMFRHMFSESKKNEKHDPPPPSSNPPVIQPSPTTEPPKS